MKSYQDKELVAKIDAYLAEHRDAIVEDLKTLVAQKSVRSEPVADCPFGEDVRKVLDLGKKVAEAHGFEAEVYDNHMYALARWGKGDKTIGLFSHLDVVPEGNGWMGKPYEPFEYKGLLIGRGVEDNKKAAVQGMYVMQMLRDLEIPFQSKVQLYMGGSEETGMEDVDQFVASHPMPDFSLVPDSEFPCCVCEKSSAGFAAKAGRKFNQIVDFAGGIAQNVVPDLAHVTLKADEALEAALKANASEKYDFAREGELLTISAHGIGAHAASPEGSVSAFKMLADLLAATEGVDKEDRATMAFVGKILADNYGEALHIAKEDELSGKLTCISGIASTEDGVLHLNFDSRCAISTTEEGVKAGLESCFGPEGWELTRYKYGKGYAYPKDDPRIVMLTDLCNAVTGKQYEPFIMGGGTYVKHLQNAIGYGAAFPDESFPELEFGSGWAHQANEANRISDMLLGIKILLLAVIEIDRYLHQ